MKVALLAGVIALSACSFGPGPRPSVERFELDVPVASKSAALPVADISLRAPSWLETPQMAYRLLYSRAARRDFYTLSRWTAPPSELVAHALRRGVLQVGEFPGGCRVRVELDEFVQEFSSANESMARIDARVRLLPPRGEAGSLSRRFEVRVPAGFADAAGGVQALNTATAQWIDEFRGWLGAVANTPAGRELCKG